MYIDEQLNNLIDEAILIAGSQRKLAGLLDMEQANLAKIKKGERPANWRVRGKLRAILGEDPAQAFMAAMAEDLEASENTDEKKAADGFKAMLAAFAGGQEKSPTEQVDGAQSWRKRRDSNPR
ncbi:hypothetical protein [Comamonas endophytica]|uniref:YdaS antitoxin of YdaST toxin-antitoxin system n=1 Tax=Comamonas endophytica TaxID=2949090 RepID=A0ABY6G9G2_9BURK|nr:MULTISPECIES: hypothetical protein [unclassified Acidovorax]MCD2514562.1 hypothetical protein [Acidovorax sp. D4N7]UYG51139.1 hypothetical protein M9799_13735 [Acidovorax sp. 5MLIR]